MGLNRTGDMVAQQGRSSPRSSDRSISPITSSLPPIATCYPLLPTSIQPIALLPKVLHMWYRELWGLPILRNYIVRHGQFRLRGEADAPVINGAGWYRLEDSTTHLLCTPFHVFGDYLSVGVSRRQWLVHHNPSTTSTGHATKSP